MLRFGASVGSRIWLSIWVLVAGYLITVTLIFVSNLNTETLLTIVNSTNFPATLIAHELGVNFRDQLKYYENAVVLGEPEALTQATQQADKVEINLQRLTEFKFFDMETQQEVSNLAQELSRFSAQCLPTYQAMANGEVNDTLIAKGKQLTKLSQELTQRLETLRHQLSERLSYKLLDTVEQLRQGRTWLMVAFLVIASSAIIFMSYTIRMVVIIPIKKLTKVMLQVAEGDLRPRTDVVSRNELGALAAGFNHFVAATQEIVGKVENAAVTMRSASRELITRTEQVDRGVNNQAERTEKIAAASIEMEQTSLGLAQSANSISGLASQAAENAEDGERVVAETLSEVRRIVAAIDNFSTIVGSLKELLGKIGKFAGMIYAIAQQTNLLALNAAIEAARAGEYGRGFGVVANEVRKLSSNTAAATTNIDATVKAIQAEMDRVTFSMQETQDIVKSGLVLAAQAGNTLTNIVKTAANLKLHVHEIASGIDQFSIATSQINEDIVGIADVAKDSALHSRRVFEEAQGLAYLAEQLHNHMARFTV